MSPAQDAGTRHLAWGDAYHELPRTCLIAPPVPAPDEWVRFPRGAYESLVGMLMGRGMPVAGHPAACTMPGCWHAQVWHAHKTRDHACTVPGCACRKLAQADQGEFAVDEPYRAVP